MSRSGFHNALTEPEFYADLMRSEGLRRLPTDGPGDAEYYADLHVRVERERLGRLLDEEAADEASIRAELDRDAEFWPTDTSEDGEHS